ncbi:hypothetical protein [Amycolatopsis aidingensis]|uniref:hypothetical protein n=1 Tax=Amycolatopsis aidingensis TaxID=2842453 RepID=UPI001C0BAB64|nr:hypothetical protein [Amycolatopsis aidingensis]
MSLLLFVFIPAGLVSLGLAAVPWRPLPLRVLLLWTQVLAAGVVVAAVPPGWEVWLLTIGPGALVAFLHGLAALLQIRDARQAGRSPAIT